MILENETEVLGGNVDKERTVIINVEFTYARPTQDRLSLSFLTQSRGGLELLFSNTRKHTVALPCDHEKGHRPSLAYLIRYLCDNLMKDRRQEMFILDGTV